MAPSGPQDEEQKDMTGPPISGASWEQFLGDSTIWFPRKMFYNKVYKNKVTLRVYSESLDTFLRSTDIRGKLGAFPRGQHHLVPQENVLEKIFIKTELL